MIVVGAPDLREVECDRLHVALGLIRNNEGSLEVLPFLCEAEITNSLPVQVSTWIGVGLCRNGCGDTSLVLELNDGFLTYSKCAVGNNPELVVPGLTCTTFFFSYIRCTILVSTI